MVKSRNEINIRRLLARCEFMVEENNDENDWRIEKFVEGLEDMILKLKSEKDEQEDVSNFNNDDISSYVKRKDFLKCYLNTKKVCSPVKKIVSAQTLPKVNINVTDVPNEIYQKVNNRYVAQVKDELFDSSRPDVFSMKQNDMDSVMNDQNKVQEKIVGEMLDMVKNIKHRSIAANNIIKQDIQSADKSSRIADTNQIKMKENNDTLGVFNKGAYKCWLWVMLGFVFILFFYMIMFIKLFKKKS